MKRTLLPTALCFAGRFPRLTLPKFKSLLLGIALLGFPIQGWSQGGTVVAWGDNRTGQGSVPAGLSDVVAIAAGEWHNLALRANGTVVAWGYNAGVPHDLGTVVAIGAGGYHNMAIKADGTVRAWGANDYGQCNVPAGLSNVVSVRGGWVHSLALKSDGTLVGWGRNQEGQATIPAGLSGVVAISVGEYHNLALKADGTVTAWGWNGYGQTTVPAGLNNVVAISAGGLHSLALKADGTVTAWGWNQFGQVTVPAGLGNVVAIAAGVEHSLALKSDGTVVGWGANDGWASNDPNCQFIGAPCERKYTGQIDVPADLNNVVAIAAGVFHSLALRGANAVQAPPAPALNVGAVSETSVTLRWSDLANETGYRLEARVGASGNWAEIAAPGANATSYQHTGLTANTTIFYRLRAFNTGGNSPYSAEVSATTTQGAIPATPVLRLGGATHNQVTLQWNDVASETGYVIERRLRLGTWSQIATPAANATSYTDATVSPSSRYYYRIKASGSSGDSDFSGEILAITAAPAANPPAAPVIAASAISPTAVRISWSAVSEALEYRLERRTPGASWGQIATREGSSTTYDNTGLNAATQYEYRMSAHNAQGSSAYSEVVAVTTPPLVQVPATPALVNGGSTHSQVMLSWADVSGETGYTLERKSGSSDWVVIASPGAGATGFTDGGVNASTTYLYRIRAFNQAGNSPYSPELSVTTQAPPQQPLTQPVLAGTVASHTSLNLAWGAVANAAEFRLERRLANSTTWEEVARIAGGTTNHVDTGLSASTAYVYRLRAFNTTAGFSAYSEELRLTTAAPISDKPLTFQVLAAGTNGLRVRISGDSGQRFKVQRTADFRNWTEVANSILLSTSIEMTLSGEDAGGFFRTVNER